MIKDVVVFGVDQYYLVCENLLTESFVTHFHSFQVSHISPPQFSICKSTELLDHHVLHSYNVSSNSYVTLKYHLIEDI